MCSEEVDLIMEAGYAKPVIAITMTGKAELMDVLKFHYTLYRNKAVLDQLKSGLDVLGVMDAMIQWPRILEPFFVGGKQGPLTAGMHVYYNSAMLCPTLTTITYTSCRHDQEHPQSSPPLGCWHIRESKRNPHTCYFLI